MSGGRSRTGLWIVCLSGCGPSLSEVADDQPCQEAGIAIARRTEECTGKRNLANARHDDFEADWACIDTRPNDPEYHAIAPDLYGCAATITSLSCDVVDEFADDLTLWLGVDASCGYIVEPKP